MLNFLPFNHKVTVTTANDELDEWGLPVKSSTVATYKARVSYNTAKKSIPVASGKEVVYTADILLEGLPVIGYTDTVAFLDMLGNVVEKQPLIVEYKADFSGNPVLVKVVI